MNIQDQFSVDPGTAEGRFSERVAHIANTAIQPGINGTRQRNVEDFRKRTQQVLCSRGRWRDRNGTDLTLSEAAELHGFEKAEFSGGAPDAVCTNCWNEAIETIEKLQAIQTADIKPRDAGYLMRWKEKRHARENWCDIIVTPEATLEEIDTHLVQYFGIGDFHMRMYGLEDEYDDSTIDILPKRQYEEAGMPSQTSASEITIGELAGQYQLWENDRLSLVYDLGTPSRWFYCIIKEALTEDNIDEYRRKADENLKQEQVFFLNQN